LLKINSQQWLGEHIMNKLAKLVVALVVGALIGMGLPGCNTVKGAGRDIQKGGQGIENAARGAQGR
jgi:predicted small secreted protein